MMEWYYSNNGQQAGPVSQEELAELFRNGTIKGTDLVWSESMTEWTPISRVSAFAAAPTFDAPAAIDTPPPMTQAPAPSAPEAASPALAASGMPEPPTYLWQSIVCLILCCMPLAIPALIFSTKVKPAYAAGNYAAALEASKKAKLFCLLALIIGFVVQVIYIGINVAVIMNEASKSGGL